MAPYADDGRNLGVQQIIFNPSDAPLVFVGLNEYFSPMVGGLKWLGRITTMVLSFMYLALVLNPIQALSILLYPVSRKACRRVNRWCARSIWGCWALIAEKQNGIEVRISGDHVPLRENVFVISNHQSMADIMIMICFAWRCGRLGHLKWFVKDVLKWIPGVGWGMYMLDCIFLKRNWARDKQDVLDLFSRFKRDEIPVFLVSFLEGTRGTPHKLAKSQAFAEANGLYVPKATMVPRTKGFVATMNGLSEHLDAVYDVTMGYPDGTPAILDCFTGKVRRVDFHVKRYAMEDLQLSDEALADWVFQRFIEKDRMMIEHAETKSFPGTHFYGPIKPLDFFRSESQVQASLMEKTDE
jgi:1-acyl-sn-glycerol-3-phosphate acyltransferase